MRAEGTEGQTMASDPLTLLMPITRDFTRDAVLSAIKSSDIPRGRAVLIFDAPVGWVSWTHGFTEMGFVVVGHNTGNDWPTGSRVERRHRHKAMRRLSQTLIPETGRLLCLEDDTLVPPDVYHRLRAIGPHATGNQIARHGNPISGILQLGLRDEAVRVCEVEAAGMYCLLTTCEAYRAATVREHGAIDHGQTRQLRPLWADYDCKCGHMTEEGVLWP